METLLPGVILEDTWVLGWNQSGHSLRFDVEASLWPGHPNYESPKHGEWACYKHAELTFEGVTSVRGLRDVNSVPSTTDPDGSKDFGSIDALSEVEGGFLIVGDFGEVHVCASAVALRLLGA